MNTNENILENIKKLSEDVKKLNENVENLYESDSEDECVSKEFISFNRQTIIDYIIYLGAMLSVAKYLNKL